MKNITLTQFEREKSSHKTDTNSVNNLHSADIKERSTNFKELKDLYENGQLYNQNWLNFHSFTEKYELSPKIEDLISFWESSTF